MESKRNRNARIRRLYEGGLALTTLGELFGLTRQRIDQIVNYEKAMARQVVQSEPMANGQACQVCGNPAEERHHDDYDEPFDIQWLCKVCHKKLHRIYKEGRRQTSIQLTSATSNQVRELKRLGFGTFTSIVRIAIDRMYKAEVVAASLAPERLAEVAEGMQGIDNVDIK